MYRLNPKMYLITKFLTLLILVKLIQNSTSHKLDALSNRTNIIDRKRSVNPSYSKDQSIDEVPTTMGCGSCQMRQDIRNRSLESIKEQILLRLGMQGPLNLTGRKLPQVPLDVLAQYPGIPIPGMVADQPQNPFKPGPVVVEEEDNMHMKTESVMSFAKPYPRLRHNWKGHGILYFQFTEKITKYRVKHATMHIWVKGSGERRPSTQDIIIEAFKVIRNPNHPETPVTIRKARTIVRQGPGEGMWVKMDATVMVSEWFKSSKENYGFILNGTLDGEKIIVTDTTAEGGSKTPFVEITTTDGRKRRTKRTIGFNCNEDAEDQICCRYPLTVDFEEFQWDFIIAPKRYQANYCAGECPMLTLQRYTHTHLVKITNPALVGPCCAPRKMSGISMLYLDPEYNIIYATLPGMVVERCGCT